MEQNHVNRMSIKDMWNYILFQTKGYGLLKFAIIAGTIGTAAITYLNYFLSSGVLNELIRERYDGALKLTVIMSLVIFGVTMLSNACENIFIHYMTPSQYEVRKRTAHKVFSMEYEKVEDPATVNDFRRVRAGETGSGGMASQLRMMREYFINIVSIAYAAIFIIMLFLRLNPSKENMAVSILLGIAFVGVFLLMLFVSDRISKWLGKKSVETERKNERYNTLGMYINTLFFSDRNSKDVRIFGMRNYMLKKNARTLVVGEVYSRFGRVAGLGMGVITLSVQILAGFTYAFVALKAAQGSIAVGDILLYAGAVLTLGKSIQEALALHNNINYSNSYLKLYEEFIERPNLGYEGTLPVEKRDDNEYTLEFKNVWFRYNGKEEYILKDFSLKFNIGEKLALVGLNGAGKTTVIKLLTRMYEPEKGEILLNGINIEKYDYNEYMSIFSVVFQDFGLFAFPLDENVASGSEIDKARLDNAIENVGLTQWVNGLENKEHTLLYKENGDGVIPSGGEAQKLAIARALYKDAPFIILDEPTAALDPIAEAEIYENFNNLVQSKTAIYISHRMSSCKFCDRIVVLGEGGISEEGTHEQLLEKNGVYAALYNTQAEYYV